MTSTQLTDISNILHIDDVYDDYADDYDGDAIQGVYVNALQASARDASGSNSITVHANGMVFIDIDDVYADQARDLDWRALVDGIDLWSVIEANELRGGAADMAQYEIRKWGGTMSYTPRNGA